MKSNVEQLLSSQLDYIYIKNYDENMKNSLNTGLVIFAFKSY